MHFNTDVLIIGAGAAGVSCAHYLRDAGRKVILVDRADVCAGASYGNAGLVCASHCDPLPAPGMIARSIQWLLDPQSPFHIKPRPDLELARWLWKFRRHCSRGHRLRALPVLKALNGASLRLFGDLAATQRPFGFRQAGHAALFASRRGLGEGLEKSRLLAGQGIGSRILPAGLLPQVTGLRSHAAGGIYYPQDAQVDPGRYVRVLARRLQSQGMPLLTFTEVIGFETSGGRIRAVVTTRGNIAAEQVVLAGGAWNLPIARELKVRLWLQPAKGYSLTYRRPAGAPEIPLMLAESKVAVVPMEDRLRLSGILELAGFDFSINRRRIQAIAATVVRYLPDLDPATFELQEIWCGMRPCTPDGLPIIGRTQRWQNLLVAGGHGTLGVLQAPITGKLICQLVLGERPEIDVTPLRPDRF